ncbi:MAG: carbohydrate-binding protein, partial [Bacteroidota bacterium]|nr:carbohydrate-binding protein [Bacteroidota bacterium]
GIITASGTGSGSTYSAAEYCVNLTVQPPTNVLEAENAFLYRAVVAANHPGYTGTGFADYLNSSGDYIEWTTNQPGAGSASLEFRYANGSTSNRPLKLEVNGVVVSSSIDFPPTGSWSTWSTITFPATLNTGTNKIKLSAIGSSGGNIDHLKVVVVSNDILEAEKASLYRAIVASNHAGYTGTGFADYINSSGDYIEWTVNQLNSVSASLQFRYANGSTTNRPLKLEVNGALVASSLNFQPTGSWSSWSTASVATTLNAGVNKVRLTAIGSSGGNIDHLKVVVSNNVLEAEDAMLYRTVVAANHAGYSGNGFADYINSSGDYIEWTANQPVSGSVLLQFRYANGSSTNRPLKLEVNGVVVTSSMDFPPTGSWSTWSTVSVATTLNAGDNKVRLTAIGSSGANIDYLAWSDNIVTASNASSELLNNATTVTKLNTRFQVTVAPNPATSIARIIWNTVSDAPIEISIIDALGIVQKTFSVQNSSTGQYDLSVRSLTPGFYLVFVRQGKEQASTKLFIKKY